MSVFVQGGKWQFEDGANGCGKWKDFLVPDQSALTSALSRGLTSTKITNRFGTYLIEFGNPPSPLRCFQTSMKTKRKRTIRYTGNFSVRGNGSVSDHSSILERVTSHPLMKSPTLPPISTRFIDSMSEKREKASQRSKIKEAALKSLKEAALKSLKQVVHSNLIMRVQISANDLPDVDNSIFSSSQPDPYFKIYQFNSGGGPCDKSNVLGNPNEHKTVVYTSSAKKNMTSCDWSEFTLRASAISQPIECEFNDFTTYHEKSALLYCFGVSFFDKDSSSEDDHLGSSLLDFRQNLPYKHYSLDRGNKIINFGVFVEPDSMKLSFLHKRSLDLFHTKRAGFFKHKVELEKKGLMNVSFDAIISPQGYANVASIMAQLASEHASVAVARCNVDLTSLQVRQSRAIFCASRQAQIACLAAAQSISQCGAPLIALAVQNKEKFIRLRAQFIQNAALVSLQASSQAKEAVERLRDVSKFAGRRHAEIVKCVRSNAFESLRRRYVTSMDSALTMQNSNGGDLSSRIQYGHERHLMIAASKPRNVTFQSLKTDKHQNYHKGDNVVLIEDLVQQPTTTKWRKGECGVVTQTCDSGGKVLVQFRNHHDEVRASPKKLNMLINSNWISHAKTLQGFRAITVDGIHKDLEGLYFKVSKDSRYDANSYYVSDKGNILHYDTRDKCWILSSTLAVLPTLISYTHLGGVLDDFFALHSKQMTKHYKLYSQYKNSVTVGIDLKQTYTSIIEPHGSSNSKVKFQAFSDHDIMHIIQRYDLEPIGYVSDVKNRKLRPDGWTLGTSLSPQQHVTRKEVRDDMFREVRVGNESDVADLGRQLTEVMMGMRGPDHWDTMRKGEQDALVTLNVSSIEYRNILRLWNKTMSNRRIVKIQRVQNLFLWQRYLMKKMQILTKNHGNANERWLWHGTNNTDPAKIWDGMNACGFDPRFGSGYYGNGAYFAVKAKYSDSYAYRKSSEGRKMFLASVICGESKNYGTTLARTLKRQPQLPSSHRRYPDSYDSVLAGPHSGSCMYVIYECEQAMPMYMVTYK